VEIVQVISFIPFIFKKKKLKMGSDQLRFMKSYYKGRIVVTRNIGREVD